MTDKNKAFVRVLGHDNETRMLVDGKEKREAICEMFSTLKSA